jgi:DnaA family protein
MSDQLLLPIELQQEQRFNNFVVGENRELVDTLVGEDESDGFRGIWIYGEASSGRSHLLRSKCLATRQASNYVGCKDFAGDATALASALTNSLHHGAVVAIDDIGALLGERDCEELLLGIYQRLIGSAGTLLISHSESSLLTTFPLADLGSRMRALMNFSIKPLNDEEKAALLEQRALARGFKLGRPVLNYWLTHGPRAMAALLEDLEALDRATLQRKQPLTVPLLKKVLGY